jgi:hypothetical protein
MGMIDNLTEIISHHLSVGQGQNIKTTSIEVDYRRNNALDLSNQFRLDESEIKMPSVCDILSTQTNPNCVGKIVTRQVK